MTDKTVSDEIRIIPLPEETVTGYEPLRGVPEAKRSVARAVTVRLAELSGGVKEFLAQMEALLQDAPAAVGGFTLSELEVSAGITADGKLTLFGVAGAEAGMEGGLKFVFRKA